MLVLGCPPVLAQSGTARPISGVIVTQKGEAVPGASVTIVSPSGEQVTMTGQNGEFRASAPAGRIVLRVAGRNLETQERSLAEQADRENLRIEVSYVIPPVHESIVIEASALEPGIDRRNDAVYKNTLFSRDDQIFQTLDAGIDAGHMREVGSRWRYAASASTSITAE